MNEYAAKMHVHDLCIWSCGNSQLFEVQQYNCQLTPEASDNELWKAYVNCQLRQVDGRGRCMHASGYMRVSGGHVSAACCGAGIQGLA